MESNNSKSNNSLQRHFYLPTNGFYNLPKKEDWAWTNNGTCLTNADRTSFPILNDEKVNDDFKYWKESMHNYEDVIYANRDYTKVDETRKVYCKHLMNHLLKCQSIMKKNTQRINDHAEKPNVDGFKPIGIRDQGFHRVRAMIIVPTKNSALEVVKCLRGLMGKHSITKLWAKFVSRYSEDGESDSEEESTDNESDEDADELMDGATSKAKELMATINENMSMLKAKHTVKKRGIDFDEWMAGNTKERFILGVSVDKKRFSVLTKLKRSDIVIGSPMAIKELIDDNKKYMTQLEITTSIEVLIVDQLEYMMMQNFDNLSQCLEKLNQTPRGGKECVKFMNSTLRVHDWHLAHLGTKYRQNIIVSAVLHPFIRKIMSSCHNFQGTSIFLPTPHYNKTDLLLLADRTIKQCHEPATKKAKKQSNSITSFSRLLFSIPVPDECNDLEIMSTSIVEMTPCDSRISLFRRKVLPILTNQLNEGGVLIYMTMTIDIYNVQQLLKSENLNVACVTEDQDSHQITKIVTLFAKGGIKYLLLSERFYALTRQRFSAVKHLIYYCTPTFPKFAHDFHEYLMHNSKATVTNPHTVINICEQEPFEQTNSALAFNVLYGQ